MNIRKSFVIALMVSALCCWSYAKSQDKDKDNGNPNGNVRITSGPTVNPSSNSATITWTTNGNAANIIHYGTDPNNLSEKHYQPGGSKEHSITLSNLQPGTTYYYAIMTDDNTVRRKGQFTTQGSTASATTPSTSSTATGPGTAQIISGPSIRTLGSTAAIVQWTTAVPSSSFVKYGTDKNNLNMAAEGSWANSVHGVRLNNLTPNTLYYMQAFSSQSAASGTSKSPIVAFTTLAPGAQARNNVPVTPVQ
jgi:phosphodiesterase/alkaline phosphatase D-like protein